MLTVATFHWQKPGYRSKFPVGIVDAHYEQFARSYSKPFRYVVITDNRKAGYRPEIETFPLWPDYADEPSPHGPSAPACYRRLKLFHPETARQIGDRILMQDLDIVYPGDTTEVFDRPEPLVLLKTDMDHAPYNGSMILMDAGCRPDLWDEFTPEIGKITKAEHCMGSDQGYLSWKLRGENVAEWQFGPRYGIYSRRHLRLGTRDAPPPDAKVIIFPGLPDPWDMRAQRKWPWLSKYYQITVDTSPPRSAAWPNDDDPEARIAYLKSRYPVRHL